MDDVRTAPVEFSALDRRHPHAPAEPGMGMVGRGTPLARVRRRPPPPLGFTASLFMSKVWATPVIVDLHQAALSSMFKTSFILRSPSPSM